MNKKLQTSDHVNLTEDIQRLLFTNNTQSSSQTESDFLVEAISSLEEKLGKEFTTEEIKVILETVVYLSEKVVRRGDTYYVMSSDGKKKLGKHKTRASAMKQLRAVEASKAKRPTEPKKNGFLSI